MHDVDSDGVGSLIVASVLCVCDADSYGSCADAGKKLKLLQKQSLTVIQQQQKPHKRTKSDLNREDPQLNVGWAMKL